MPNMQPEELGQIDIKHPEHVCAKCDDSLTPLALLPAVRHIRRELNGKLDEIEAAALDAQKIERRVTGL